MVYLETCNSEKTDEVVHLRSYFGFEEVVRKPFLEQTKIRKTRKIGITVIYAKTFQAACLLRRGGLWKLGFPLILHGGSHRYRVLPDPWGFSFEVADPGFPFGNVPPPPPLTCLLRRRHPAAPPRAVARQLVAEHQRVGLPVRQIVRPTVLAQCQDPRQRRDTAPHRRQRSERQDHPRQPPCERPAQASPRAVGNQVQQAGIARQQPALSEFDST